MADIVYTIEYDDETGFKKPQQHITRIGTRPDRVGFVTTKETAEYLAEDGKKVALKRKRSPFKRGVMKNPYIVPVGKPEFFDVVESGGRRAFLFDCGTVNASGRFGAFRRKKTKPVEPVSSHPRPEDPDPSLPFPD
jgi:hypothetical protein